jgi:superfamily I DNA/RNA helicase
MNLTIQQQAAVAAIRGTSSHLALVARAGCGKTSTILLMVDEIRAAFPRAEVAVVAFNKAIANEVKEKLEKRGHRDFRLTQAGTLHSLGFSLIKFGLNRNVDLDDKKVKNIIKRINDPFADFYANVIETLVRKAKSEGFGFFNDKQIGDAHAWYMMADHYDINGFENTSDMDQCVEYAQRVYRASLQETGTIDFDDMILFPLVHNIQVRFPKDFVFVDEAQDMSRARQALVYKFIKPRTGRMIIVGDDRQAIYGFSGADSDALNNMRDRLNATVIPLSVTFRCPVSVVKKAQMLVPDIEWAPGAKEGRVDVITEPPTDIGPGTAVLCRNTAPLIENVYSLIRRGIAAKVEGRDIGEGLLQLIRRWKTNDIDVYLSKLDDYEQRETQKAAAKSNDAKVQQIEDKCATVKCIANQCILEGNPTVSAMVTAVENLFGDDVTGCVVFATYHRSKGREWPRVILIQHDRFCPSPFAKQEWQLQQEDNLAYVAFTRAEEELLFWE